MIDLTSALKNLRDDLILWTSNNLKQKVTKEKGKRLSTNDFTDADKAKLNNLDPVGAIVLRDSADASFSFGEWEIVKEEQEIYYFKRIK